MKIGSVLSKLVIIMSGLLLSSCLLPGMIPLNQETAGPMPVLEKNTDKVLEVLNSRNYVRLEAFAQERYREDEAPLRRGCPASVVRQVPVGEFLHAHDFLSRVFDVRGLEVEIVLRRIPWIKRGDAVIIRDLGYRAAGRDIMTVG